jgi:hypothetical protein
MPLTRRFSRVSINCFIEHAKRSSFHVAAMREFESVMQGGSIRNRTRHLDALVNPSLQRIKPIRTQQWNLALDSDIPGHGVISSGGANRRVLRCELGDYAIGSAARCLSKYGSCCSGP